MLDKILYVVGKSDMPLQLLHSVLSTFLWIGTIIDSFDSSGSSSLLQIAMILWKRKKKENSENLALQIPQYSTVD